MKKIFTTVLVVLLCLKTFAQLKSTKEDRAYWNGFVTYIESKGLKGSKTLDCRQRNLAAKLFADYNKLNNKSIKYSSFVTLVQRDIIEYRKQALEQIRQSREKHQQNPQYRLLFDGSDDQFMPGLSVVDGFAGVLTTSWRFPNENVIGANATNDLYASNR